MSLDPFTGSWTLVHRDSSLAGPTPQRWIQNIKITGEEITVREHIAFDTGLTAEVSAEAKFDGKDYPVYGSPVADTIAYTRPGRLLISGTAKKAGIIRITEIVSVSEDGGTLTMRYTLHNSREEKTSSVAVFRKESEEAMLC